MPPDTLFAPILLAVFISGLLLLLALTSAPARLWRYRTELLLLAALLLGSHAAAQHHLRGLYWTLIGVGVLLLAQFETPRRALRPLTASRTRRCVDAALGHAQLNATSTRVTPTDVGARVRVRLALGSNQDELVQAAPTLKTSLNARAVDVERDQDKGRYVTLTITNRDPFAVPIIPWPNEHRRQLSMWDPIPLGRNQDGDQIDLQLFNPTQGARSILIAGETGSGKTVALTLILTTAHRATDAHRTWLADGTELDTAHWREHVHAYAGADRTAMNYMLRAILEAMDQRKADLMDQGKVRVMPGDPVDLIVIDELPFFVNASAKDKQESALAKANRMMLADISRRGRKYGFALAVIVQKPTVDAIPADLREMLTYRLAFRLKTKEAVRAALGADLVADGWDTTLLRPDKIGVAILDAQAALPTWLKVFFLPPTTDIRHPSGPRQRTWPLAVRERVSVPEEDSDAPDRVSVPGADPARFVVPNPALAGAGTNGPRVAKWLPPQPGPGVGGQAPVRSTGLGRVAVAPVRRQAMEARVSAHLSPVPVSRKELGRRLGVDPSNGTLRRALAAMEADGRAAQITGGWVLGSVPVEPGCLGAAIE